MNDWAGLFLGVIALAGVVQCVFVIVAARSVQGTGRRVSDLCDRFDKEVKPAIEDLKQGAANIRAITDAGHVQARRLEALVSSTIERVDSTVETARQAVLGPISSISDLSAFWGGLKRGLDSFRASSARRRQAPSARRSEDSDEHLFIG